ncbi:MAG: hypothetical protein V3S46_09310 [Nitrospinota bacterium]
MKVALRDGDTRVQAEFNPEEIRWKSRNFGWFTPDGVYFPEIDKTLFVKRLPGRPLSLQFLKSHMDRPCSEHLPAVYGVIEGDKTSYFFMERIKGIPLDALRGKIEIAHCREILSGIFKAVSGIADSGYWYTDLDFGNVFLGKGDSGELVRLIDIDSCVRSSIIFKSYMEDPGRRLNVNERYWSYLVSSIKRMEKKGMNGEGLSRLRGRSIAQSAFMYFAVDLFFHVKYPKMSFSLKPADLIRLMRPGNRKYFTPRAKKLWRQIHRRLRNNPEKGVKWGAVDKFVTAAYRFPQGLERQKRTLAGESLVDGIVNVFERFFEIWE